MQIQHTAPQRPDFFRSEWLFRTAAARLLREVAPSPVGPLVRGPVL